MKKLQAIRRAKNQVAKLELAHDILPGTEFDLDLEEISDALRWYKTGNGTVKQTGERLLLSWAETFGDAIRRGDSNMFREYADAIDVLRGHKPNPDKARACLIQFCILRKPPFRHREVKAHMEANGFGNCNLRRMCKELGYVIHGSPGAPPKNRDKNPIRKQ